MKRWLVRIAVALGIVFVLIQFVPVDRSNPPLGKTLEAPPAALAILRRSCFDCHSNETHWPWYAYVAPASWLVAHDVEDGRHELNFSIWGDTKDTKRLSLAGQIVDEIVEGAMPPSQYLYLHGDAKLSAADVAVLQSWADSVD